MQLLRSVRFVNNTGECSSSKLHPHPCLLRRTLIAARSAMVAAETSAPTTAQHTAKPAPNAASMAILLPYAESSQRPAHATGNGSRACHRKWRTLQLSSSQSEAWQTQPYRRQQDHVLLSCVNCHISRLVDASQIRVSSSRSVKPLSPFGGLCIVQSSMMCCTDWFGAPHSHSEVDFRPHLFMASPNLPTPVRIRL